MQVTEKAKILNSILIPTFFVIFLWLVKLSEIIFHLDFAVYGIMPLKISGLIGIMAAPLIHGDVAHLSANSVPMWVLMATLLYFYRPIAWKVFLLIYLITGFWIWVWARESYHIGASGVVYGLATFLFLSGIFRKESRLMAISMFIIFTYGSLVWGIFPQLFPHKNISWESHLMGIVAGVVIAVFYRNEGPQRRKFTWEIEEESEDDENAYWRVPPPTPPPPALPPANQPAPIEINYIYKETEKPDKRDDSEAEKA